MSTASSLNSCRMLLAISSLSAGGAERIISEMANWWASQGREIAVLILEKSYIDHYQLHPAVKRISFDWQLPRTRLHIPIQYIKNKLILRNIALDYFPDVLISFVDKTNLRLLFILAGTGIPFIVSERVDPRYHNIGFFWSLARWLLYPLSDALVVQTNSVTAWANRVVPRNKVRVIPNFVRSIPGPDKMTKGSTCHHPYILAVGRLGKQKGHDILIQAFARGGARSKGWRLVILGEGPERSNLEKLALNLGISDVVDMPGIVSEPAEWIFKAQFFVLASRFEGFPNVLLEAMACGCPVIATDCPSGPAEIIRHNENGLLVPNEDIAALSTTMDRLMEDEELRSRLSHRALEVRSRFSQTKIMEQWDDLVENICMHPK